VLFNQPIQTSVSPTYPVFPRSIEANAVLYELAGRGTPEVHGKMDLSKHMRFQSVRLVGAVGIETESLTSKSRWEKALPGRPPNQMLEMLETFLF
jgi:hypothetical protein